MNNILEVQHLCKSFPRSDFHLNNISFSLPYGSIMGFVGENGAGKTTTINCILNALFQDSGTIRLFGREMTDRDTPIREEIGVVFDASNFSGNLTPGQLSRIMGGIYARWDPEVFFGYLRTFRLPPRQKIKEYSKGMTMLLAIAAALSHSPKLLILDEPTSGLDPVMRDDILDVFLDFIQQEDHSILLSSHITGDLEKISDFITFIHKGNIILSAKKDDLLYQYAVLRCGESQLPAIDKADILAYRRRDHQTDVLITNRQAAQRKYKGMVIDPVSIDDMMVLLTKGERV